MHKTITTQKINFSLDLYTQNCSIDNVHQEGNIF